MESTTNQQEESNQNLQEEMKEFYSSYPNLIAVAFGNSKKRFFVGSRQNYFEGIQVERLMFDTVCMTTLLPLTDNDSLDKVLKDFSDSKYKFSIMNSKGVGSKNISLVVKKKESNFKIELAKDILSNAKPFYLNMIRFFLHLEDAKNLKKLHDRKKLFSPIQVIFLHSKNSLMPIPIPSKCQTKDEIML